MTMECQRCKMNRLDQLLASGRRRLENFGDRKDYVTLDDIRFLVSQGAHIDCNNRRQDDGRYLHEVVWNNTYWYVTTTEEIVKLC